RAEASTCGSSASMKTDVTIPASDRRAIAARSLVSWPATSSPPSVVISSRPSGTSIAISGRNRHAMSTISDVAAISRLSLIWTRSRSLRTSSSWMCRRSSRRCTVMPSAPPRCASTAPQTGSGSYVRRAWRSVATWSMLTPSSITSDVPFSSHLLVVFERRQLLHDAAALDAARLEIVIEHAAHQPLRLRCGLRVGIVRGRERKQRRPAHDRAPRIGLARDEARSAVECVMVAFGGGDRRAGVDIVRKRQRVTELGQEPPLASAPRRRLRGRAHVAGERMQRRGVLGVKGRMRILARKQLQQQLVQIETAEQRGARRQRKAAAPLGLDERLELARAGPRQRKRLERLQQ